ncbi:MAG: CHAD domain-containing protein [Vicinamibacterales bacterium]
MAYRLKGRSIPKDLRRLVRKELDATIDGLQGAEVTERAIYEARKRIKKARAILKLLKDALGENYAAENSQLRSVGQGLGRLRDPEAMVETLDAIRGRCSTVISYAIKQRVARGLRSRHYQARQSAPDVARHAVGILKRARKTLPDEVAKAGNLAAVRKGLASVYKQSRAALEALTLDADAVAFHTWRRRVKEHWYHVRLFEGRHPAPRSRARSLRALEKELGEEHNLAMLNDVLLKNPGRFGDARTTDLVLGCIQKRQRVLRQQALARGRRLFVAKPKEVEAEVKAWWRGRQ